MNLGNVITIFMVLGGVIMSLIAVIYSILLKRINFNSKNNAKLAVHISRIDTNIEWIKRKLN